MDLTNKTILESHPDETDLMLDRAEAAALLDVMEQFCEDNPNHPLMNGKDEDDVNKYLGHILADLSCFVEDVPLEDDRMALGILTTKPVAREVVRAIALYDYGRLIPFLERMELMDIYHEFKK